MGEPRPARDGVDKHLRQQSCRITILRPDPEIRLVFVAGMIPPELRRIVEFLNEQMDSAEVIALEVGQFVGQGLQTLVPRLIGLSARPLVGQ